MISRNGLPRTAVVGVLGGGQLGKMLAQEAAKMGITLKVLDPTPSCPASVVAEQVVGSFRDPEAVKSFAQGVDLLTVEIEHIDADAMQAVAEQSGVEVQPLPETLRIIQDKYRQKQHFQEAGNIPMPEFRNIKCEKCAESAGRAFGYPFMLKSKTLAYDGRGNAVVRSAEALPAAVESLGGYEKGLYAEKWVPFVCELAVMVARSRDGSIMSFPVVQTIHKNNICHTTETPALVPPAVQARAREVAEHAVECLQGAGVFGVEMFLLPDGSLLLNEVAPRPHNSGHYTIEACATDQYEAHLRAILGWPLGDPSLAVGAALMLNVLGEAGGEEGMRAAHELMGRAYKGWHVPCELKESGGEVPGASVHWYGKAEVADQRKVGHITIVGKDNAECRQRLRAIDPRAADAMEAASRAVATQLQPAAAGSGGSAAGGALVGVIMGSDSDLPTMKAAAEVLHDFGVACEVTVVSAHRTPERMFDYARGAHQRGMKVIIAGAGGAAHLPGMVAAMTPLPVVGVPVKPAGAHLDGLDALMSIVQMPKGVPVATVAIGNAANAGLLAVRILAASDPVLQQQMLEYQEQMTQTVLGKAERLESRGWRDY
ncbi:hypothetical protein N2152v2_009187 [Parachlorella kessleri]